MCHESAVILFNISFNRSRNEFNQTFSNTRYTNLQFFFVDSSSFQEWLMYFQRKLESCEQCFMLKHRAALPFCYCCTDCVVVYLVISWLTWHLEHIAFVYYVYVNIEKNLSNVVCKWTYQCDTMGWKSLLVSMYCM